VETAIGIIFGGILTILVAVWVEWLRRPKLKLSIEPPIDIMINPGNLNSRSLRVLASNASLSRFLFFMVRSPALQCRATITFHRHADGQDIFGKPMAARWAGALQPNSIPIVDNAGNVVSRILDPERIGVGSRMDIYPGEFEPLDIVARIENDPECYGWNNETYFTQPFGRNQNWKLAADRFLARVTITSSGQKCIGVFRLINDVPRNVFRLELANREEILKIECAG